MKTSTQVAVIGGGPAGATVSALLAQQGFDVMVFERDEFPRFHIGESLMTETWWVFEKLGLVEKLGKSLYPRKHSVQFISEDGRASRPFYFGSVNPHESAVTWQVDRASFDLMMLDAAREQGADIIMKAQVETVLFDGDRAIGLRVTSDGETRDIRSRVVVDASGLHALLGRQLKLLEMDPELRKATIFAHYEGAYRDEGIDEGATLIIHGTGNRGWFWNIPLDGDRASVGVVGTSEELLKGKGRPEEILAAEIAANSTMSRRLKTARLCSPVRVMNDFSYRSRRLAGEGWLLLGDAFGFIDPVYSSGVFLALKSGELAAKTIAAGLEANDLSGHQLGSFGQDYVAGLEALRKLVYAFYTPGFSFADFVRKHPEHSRRLIDLLTGNVFKEGVTDIFDDMKTFCDLPDERPLQSI